MFLYLNLSVSFPIEVIDNIYIDNFALHHINAVKGTFKPDIIKFNSIGRPIRGKASLKTRNGKYVIVKYSRIPTIFYICEESKQLDYIQAEHITLSWSDMDDFERIPGYDFTIFYCLNSINFKQISHSVSLSLHDLGTREPIL